MVSAASKLPQAIREDESAKKKDNDAGEVCGIAIETSEGWGIPIRECTFVSLS